LAYQVIKVFFYGLKWGDIHRKYQNLKVQGKKVPDYLIHWISYFMI